MKLARLVVLALLGSLVFGLAVGTWIRLRLERPVRHFVTKEASASGPAWVPGDVGHACAPVLDAGDHEEQV